MSLAAPGSTLPAPVRRIVAAHAQRGITLQIIVRLVLVVFVLCTLILLPPAVGAAGCAAIAAVYAVLALALTGWLSRRGPAAVTWGWIGLYVDLLALSALSVVAGQSAQDSWTSLVLLGGFFLLPVLAATQLRWAVCAGVVVPTVLLYLIEAVATRQANDEPWASIGLRAVVLAAVGAAAVGLTVIQRSRMAAISRLVSDRATLLEEVLTVTETERATLAEALHDGALQYVLAARMDLDDLRWPATGPQADEVVDRLDEALTRTAGLLRGAVSDLHPAVLERAGLAAAVRDLARPAADRAGLTLHLDMKAWPAALRTPHDQLLFGAARELITNVVKHAAARNLWITLAVTSGRAGMTVRDDGIGIDPATLPQRLQQGHIGLHAQRVKVEAVGGSLDIAGHRAGGTTVTVTIPLSNEGGSG